MSNKVKLISEEFVSDVEYITEEKENGKKQKQNKLQKKDQWKVHTKRCILSNC